MVYFVKEYVSIKTLTSIYYTIFDSQLNYDNFIWGQNINAIKRLFFRKKALGSVKVSN